jgi:hypothetical protein
MMSTKPCARLWRALQALRRPWVMSGCPLLLLAACAAPAPQSAQIQPPPADLAALCDPGPAYPAGDVALDELLDVVAQRETAAAICRARHAGLVKAWPQ